MPIINTGLMLFPDAINKESKLGITIPNNPNISNNDAILVYHALALFPPIFIVYYIIIPV
jgi:hypothetical protein